MKKTEWIDNTPEGVKEAEDINNIRIGSGMIDGTINPKIKRFKITDMTCGPQYVNSPKGFIAEIDEQSTLEDQVQIAHKIFTSIAYSNSRSLYKGKIVNANILVDESVGLVAYRTYSSIPVLTMNNFSKNSIDEDVFLLKKEGELLKGKQIAGRGHYSSENINAINLNSIEDNILNYSITKGERWSKEEQVTTHYEYDIEKMKK